MNYFVENLGVESCLGMMRCPGHCYVLDYKERWYIAQEVASVIL